MRPSKQPTLKERFESLDLSDPQMEQRQREREQKEQEQARAQAIPEPTEVLIDPKILTAQAEALISEAFDPHRDERFTCVTPKNTWQSRMVGRYLDRKNLGKLIAKRLFMGVAGVAILGGFFEGVDMWRKNNALTDASYLVHQSNTLQSQLSEKQEKVKEDLKNYISSPQVQAPKSIVQPLEEKLNQVQAKLSLIAPLTLNQQWVWSHQPTVEKNQALIGKIKTVLDETTPLLNDLNSHSALTHQLLNHPSDKLMEKLKPAGLVVESKWQDELEKGTRAGIIAAGGALRKMNGLSSMGQTWSETQTFIGANGIPSAEEKQALQPFFTQAQTLVESGDIMGSKKMLKAAERLHTQFNLTYSLQIADGAQVQSGIWRYQNGHENARSYYIIVDAIGPDGRAVKIPIKSLETAKTLSVSHFAVRVPPATYDSVKADKLDNGLIDQRSFGKKPAGTLNVDYQLPVENGFITHW